ncbi:8680_t:CDS:2 [Acaulospora morrowiae]|uniref:8680_t:CDS:1 n=1 Tax=Acaulospora morrowiae TaxID=94023 RepID=A0A9N8ZIU1_9GLOM|nr:8680_t:CDS:2 [Acaulospora morrowiae]
MKKEIKGKKKEENSEEDRESGDLESTNSEAESNIGNSQSEPEGVPLEELSDSEIEGDIIPKQRVTINNKSALRKICNEIKIDAPWIETQSITSSEPVVIKDVHNDVERELAFYKQALEAAVEGREKIITSGVPFSRPDDYFAEMIKSDEHMSKIRKKLIDEEKGIKASEEARRQRELRKFGKKVQVEKIQERQKQKKEELEKIKLLKKKRKGIEENVDDDFEIALDEAAEDDRPKKRQNTGKNKKRLTKDVKFGFGGKKRFSKSNTSETSGDLSGFGASGGKGNFQEKPEDRVQETKNASLFNRESFAGPF